MDTSNTKSHKDERRFSPSETCTDVSGNARPGWRTSYSALPSSHSSSRKLYILLGLWVLVLTVAVALTPGKEDYTSYPGRADSPTAFTAFVPTESAQVHPTEEKEGVGLLAALCDALPSSFRHTRANEITGGEFLASLRPVLRKKERPLRVWHIGDSHVAGRAFPTAVRETLQKYLGHAERPDSGAGVYFSYSGRNGATAQSFPLSARAEQVADFPPDLIIVSFGTNEAHTMAYREDLHEQQLDELVARLREMFPQAMLLLTTPPGDYLRTRYVRYRRTSRVRSSVSPNPMSNRCAETILQYGKAHDTAVWDMYRICGGEDYAQLNWVKKHYMRPDRIHFTPAGYALQGQLLGEAIARAFSSPLP